MDWYPCTWLLLCVLAYYYRHVLAELIQQIWWLKKKPESSEMTTPECAGVMWNISHWESCQGELRSPSIILNLSCKLVDEEKRDTGTGHFLLKGHFGLDFSLIAFSQTATISKLCFLCSLEYNGNRHHVRRYKDRKMITIGRMKGEVQSLVK